MKKTETFTFENRTFRIKRDAEGVVTDIREKRTGTFYAPVYNASYENRGIVKPNPNSTIRRLLAAINKENEQ